MRKSRIVSNSPRFQKIKKEKHRVLRKKILFWIFLIILVLIGLTFLSRWSKININTIEISGNKILEKEAIESTVREEISGNYLWFLPKTNFLIYPQRGIEAELKNKFKRIESVFVNDKNVNTLEIILTERTALYTWCGETLPEINTQGVNENKCYFVDKEGFIFDEAPYFSGEVYLKFYGAVSMNEDNPSGSYFLKPYFTNLISLKDSFEKIGVKPVIFYADESGDIKAYLSSQIKSQLGPAIIFKADSDYTKIVGNLQSILSTEPLQTDLKTKYNSLNYIDLRFGNKVYYKFK